MPRSLTAVLFLAAIVLGTVWAYQKVTKKPITSLGMA
jgi:hypothetical protein